MELEVSSQQRVFRAKIISEADQVGESSPISTLHHVCFYLFEDATVVFFNIVKSLVVMQWVNLNKATVLLEALDIKESVKLGHDALLDVFRHKRHKFFPQVLSERHRCVEVLQLEVLLVLEHLLHYVLYLKVKCHYILIWIDPLKNPNDKVRRIELPQQGIHLLSVLFGFASTATFGSKFKVQSHWWTVRNMGP